MPKDDVVKVGAEPAPQPAPAPEPAPPAPALPKKIEMTSLYGFFDENHRYRDWHEGVVITDEAEIKLLSDRKAPFKVLEA